MALITSVLLLVGCANTSNNSSYQPSTPAVSENVAVEKPVVAEIAVLPKETFSSGLGAWYEETWYKKQNSGGEVVTGSNGLTFKGVQSNSRSGVMLDLNQDVNEFKKLNLEVVVQADIQTLEGTGFQGREAPIAVAMSYQDVDGTEHNLLGEDPNASGQMFWRGFYYLDPADKSGSINGVKVPQAKPYTFKFDLMRLNPKPTKIYFVSLEGAGWKEREGKIISISIVGEK